MNVCPLSDWILVKFFPLKKRSNIIELAGQQSDSAVRLGEVVAVGPGRPLKKTVGREPMFVEPGAKIAFFRWHQEHRPGKAVSESLSRISHELGEDVCLIRQSDILFEYTGDVDVDI